MKARQTSTLRGETWSRYTFSGKLFAAVLSRLLVSPSLPDHRLLHDG